MEGIIETVLKASFVSYNLSSNLINIKLTVIKRKVQIHPSAINYRDERWGWGERIFFNKFEAPAFKGFRSLDLSGASRNRQGYSLWFFSNNQ